MSAPKPKVFISYNWNTKPLVLGTCATLATRGITYWRDEEQVRPGDVLYARIAQGISESAAVLVFLSPNYLSSENCNRELQLAAAYRKPMIVLRLGVPCPPPVSAGTFAAHMAPILANGKCVWHLPCSLMATLGAPVPGKSGRCKACSAAEPAVAAADADSDCNRVL